MRLSFFFLAASLNLPVSIVSAETSLSNLRFYVLYLCEKNSLKNKKKKEEVEEKKTKFDFYQRREKCRYPPLRIIQLTGSVTYALSWLQIMHIGGSIF